MDRGVLELRCPSCGSQDVSVCMKAWLHASLEGGQRVLDWSGADGLGSWCDHDEAQCQECAWEGKALEMERAEAPDGCLTTYARWWEKRRKR